jgi:hypothetical protein
MIQTTVVGSYPVPAWLRVYNTRESLRDAMMVLLKTPVMHEPGHALGLARSANPTSVMYATVAAGTTNRNLNVAELNVPDGDGGGASGLYARVFSLAPRPVRQCLLGQSQTARAVIGAVAAAEGRPDRPDASENERPGVEVGSLSREAGAQPVALHPQKAGRPDGVDFAGAISFVNSDNQRQRGACGPHVVSCGHLYGPMARPSPAVMVENRERPTPGESQVDDLNGTVAPIDPELVILKRLINDLAEKTAMWVLGLDGTRAVHPRSHQGE